jgi:hypothetical protein
VYEHKENDLVSLITKLSDKFEKHSKDVEEIKRRSPSSPVQSEGGHKEGGKVIVKCFYCHKQGHMRKDCPSLKAKDMEAAKGAAKGSSSDFKNKGETFPHASVGSNTVGLESGLFVNANINGLDSKLLVDTEATLTLISAKLIQNSEVNNV